ncbi:hypothetical protein S40285_02695 [Stachybotrys chlorohalonatus IBT 40285]|uniref:Bud22 domain-containing protein n=1 Tax=Stachybotrys chlorohalonatus (strain IBT 40285) TaxID=1283841 RepID=A0A084QMY7_STAC4|nr:hypothetical protein S40285_02695 [Stachybotrys chlorohalonata IBT 40285]
MPKRKRSGETDLQELLAKSQVAVQQALKEAKGHERQRLTKRLRDARTTPDKKERLDREVLVLKSLDLHQVARTHLYSSLLKVKAIAASTSLPDEVRAGPPKLDISEAEKTALHNVTSGLSSRVQVKQAVDRAIHEICEALDVPVPEAGKRQKKNKAESKDEEKATLPDKEPLQATKQEDGNQNEGEDDRWGDESDFQGFETDVDEPGSVAGDAEPDVEVGEEAEFSKYDDLLGSSSDEEEEGLDEDLLERYRGKETVNLDDISLSEADSGEESDVDLDSDDEAELSTTMDHNQAKAVPEKKQKKTKSSVAPGPVRDSTFLPSLMSGYISGSESASDVDVAPAKKRLGQRQRQAIYEKKYGARAKHLQNDTKRSGRDQGWDMRRGAVDGDDKRRRTPWKQGVRNPLGRDDQRRSAGVPQPVVERKKDDEGPLHASWEARKKAKEAQKNVAFEGKKVVFD